MIRKPIEEPETVVWGNVTELERTQGTVGMTAISLFSVSFTGSSTFFLSSSVGGVAHVGGVMVVLVGGCCGVEPLGFPKGGLTNL